MCPFCWMHGTVTIDDLAMAVEYNVGTENSLEQNPDTYSDRVMYSDSDSRTSPRNV